METCLYQFSVSHYCEKARWALDYKGISYRVRNLLPGRHIKPVRAIAPDSSVPVLQIQDQIIQGSDQIIDYLDRHFPDKPLTPQEPELCAQVMRWEQFAADKLADPLRCIFYHYLLQEPKVLLPILASGGPWYGPLWLRLGYARMNAIMRKTYQINSRTAQVAMHVVDKAIKHLENHLATHALLAGERFTRADLSVAALLSPLVLPERGYLKPEVLGHGALLDYRKAHVNSPVFRWVNTLYNNYR